MRQLKVWINLMMPLMQHLPQLRHLLQPRLLGPSKNKFSYQDSYFLAVCIYSLG